MGRLGFALEDLNEGGAVALERLGLHFEEEHLRMAAGFRPDRCSANKESELRDQVHSWDPKPWQ
jgi:hypothetical protein